MSKPDQEAVVHTVKSLRAARGLSQSEVARRAVVSVNTYARIERGESGFESRTRAVANALGVSYVALTEAMDEARRQRERN